MPTDDVADSTDWLATPLAGLAAVEAALRCQVCKDFYKTPMLTTCSHTFCSICIRRALSGDGKCPLCRAPDQELKLRSNWSMEESVDAFTKARTAALEFARNANARSKSPKRKAEAAEIEADAPTDNKRPRMSARLSSRTGPPPPHVEVVEDSNDEAEETGSEEDYTPEINDGLVPCPTCNKRMKDWQVFAHLDSCTGLSIDPVQPTEAPKPAGQLQRAPRTLDRLPALNYSMFKEQALRKKLGDLGILNQGPRQLLERRHKEWITIWNANCDAAQPRKRSQLLHDLDTWERTQGGKAPTTSKAIQNAMAIKDKDFDGAAWATKHDDSFKDLIANARKSRLEAKKKADEAKAEEEAKAQQNAESQKENMATEPLQNGDVSMEEVVPPTTGPLEVQLLQ